MPWSRLWATLGLALPLAAASSGVNRRTNFASVDCAAAVVDASPGLKAASSMLSESKESYMLSECAEQHKYVVVKLCQDIHVDTVVLANYEFFSSLYKDVRVSVSDNYLADPTDWHPLGTFRAENVRREHAFAITDPRIWASYLRVDFVSHWDDEFYCPVSSLQVYGTTMMDHYKQKTKGSAAQVQAGAAAAQKLADFVGDNVDKLQGGAQDLVLVDENCADDAQWAAGPSVPSTFCPVQPPTVLSAVDGQSPGDSACRAVQLERSPLLQRQCCPGPALPPAVPVVSEFSVSAQESVYESLMRRIELLETSNAVLRTLYDKSFGMQASALESFFDSLNTTLLSNVGAVADKNAELTALVAYLNSQMSYHRFTLFAQMLLLAGLAAYVLHRLVPRAPRRVALGAPARWKRHRRLTSASDEDYLLEDSRLELEVSDDTYGPDTSLFSPSPSRPSSMVTDD